MLKKINIIIIFSSIILSIKLNLGLSLFLPVILFYVLKDIKNIYYSYIPTILVSLMFLQNEFIYILLVLVINILFYLFLTKTKIQNKLLTSVIIFYLISVNNLYFILSNNISIDIMLITSLLSSIIYIYLEKHLYKMLLEKTTTFKQALTSLAYLDILISILCTISSSSITIYNLNLGLIYGVYFAMYFGKNYKNIYAFVYSITSMLILYIFFNIKEAIFIPFTSSLYIVSTVLTPVVYNIFVATLIFLNNDYSSSSLISFMVVSIIFEFISYYLTEEVKTDNDIFEYIYNQIQKNTSDEILNFSVFLDKFSTNFKNPQEFNERISDGIKVLVQNHCTNCPKKKECFNKYKMELYEIFKSLLLQEPNFKIKYPEFDGYCGKIANFEHTTKFLETKIKAPLNEETKNNNHILLAQLNGVSNTIKKYVVDISTKKELSYYNLMLIKRRLENYGYSVTYFEVVKIFEDDFNVKIGITSSSLDLIENTLKLISENILERPVSIILDKIERGNIYVNLVPKIKIDITYGYGALSSEGEDICGDNYLIKEINNGRFISAISDGMGKGYRAFYESDMTLKLVEDIIKLNVSTGTALEILNSYYLVQEYLEEYATLDFLEINRYTETANFYKMGGATSYIFKADGQVEKIFNKSLPFGLDDEIETTSYQLSHGDLILMSSDGIFENIIDETSLQEYIESIKNLPPQKIVYELLNYTINNKIKTKDDMSIIALKIAKVA